MSEQANSEEEHTPQSVSEDTLKEMARIQGWVPKEEYRGDPTDWRDYKEFLDIGERIQPILRERNKALLDRIAALEKTIADFAGHYKRVSADAYNKALADLKAAQLAAVEEGDAKAYADLEAQRTKLEESRPEPETTETLQAPPGFAEFRAANPWYGQDAPMSMYADLIGEYLHRVNPHQSVDSEFYERVEAEVKARFPEKFRQPSSRPTEPPSPPVEGEGSSPGGGGASGGKHTYEKLPPEAKAQCDRFVKEGLLTKEQYVADYDWEE